jgi:uncharacterized protein Yka (UPF0111/DUF47 family)
MKKSELQQRVQELEIQVQTLEDEIRNMVNDEAEKETCITDDINSYEQMIDDLNFQVDNLKEYIEKLEDILDNNNIDY